MLDRISLITGNPGKATASRYSPAPSHRTYAQMTSEAKNKISHRRQAVDAMRDRLGLR